ncbi:MAG: 23S rRNA (adenine(2503)-C(2))-methyltransferase RlmN [Candidatus Omnitrophica bacterium]|nr:23S rRNA (adenine(2503)-C(2))-methyltransferase RlmN [Candidatus Omnitrophota bacterium]
MKKDIKDFKLEELEKILVSRRFSIFSAKQIFTWIYKKHTKDFAKMTDLSLDLRRFLDENFYIQGLNLRKSQRSSDRTEKYLFELKDKALIEAVLIPTQKRATGCLSTQVGCKFSCRFCASGLLGFKRNLNCGEIVEEALWLKEKSSYTDLTHIVFMGIGEPLDNYDNLIKAIRIINSKYGLNIGARRITISTCGIIPAMERLMEEGLQVELSISLHAADDELRAKIMPINKVYPLEELLNACQRYIKRTNRLITFEYLLMEGINSDLPNAKKLVKILKDLRLYKVNLIMANPVEEYRIKPPEKEEAIKFKNYLLSCKINTTLRRPRGQDIQAACGQLRLRYEKD